MPAYTPTGRTEIVRQRGLLAMLVARAESVDPVDEIHADLTRLICVRIVGFLEQSMTKLGQSAVERQSGGIAQSWGASFLRRVPNPTADEIVNFVGRFSVKWRAELEELLRHDERRVRIGSLLGIRNDIAHGKNQGVSLKQAQGYLDLVHEIVDWLADRLEPKPGLQPPTPP